MVTRTRVLVGEAHPRCKLSSREVNEIRLRAMRGESYRSIARVFGVGFNVVGKIVRFEIRTDINGVRALAVSMVR
jgi:hypothetical protein